MHRTRRLISLAAVLAVLATLIAIGAAPARADDPSQTGQWLAPFSEGGLFDAAPPATPDQSIKLPPAVSIAALPNGQYAYWAGLENLEEDPWPLAIDAGRVAKNSRSRLLTFTDTGEAVWQTPTPEDGGWFDMFCADQRLLLDGSLMNTGGTKWVRSPVSLNDNPNDGSIPSGGTDLWGNEATRIFQAGRSGGTWTLVGNAVTDSSGNTTGYTGFMHHGRWYPAMVTLPDGRLFVAGGVNHLQYNTELTNVHPTETFNPFNAAGVYDPVHGSWTENASSGDVSLPLFARLHLVPGKNDDGSDAKVLYDGVGQMFSPYGESYDEALWNVRKFYDPATNSWSDGGIGTFGALNGASSIMLPFTADNGYKTARILHAGGTLGVTPGTYLGTAESELLTVNGTDIQTKQLPDLPTRRWYSSSVVGPTGEVFLFNGADKDEVLGPGTEFPVHEVDMFDPVSQTWKALASSKRDRTYHNTALLMADGSILVGGHSPINTLYGPGNSATGDSNYLHNNTGLTANNLKDPSFEIFKPPYMFRAGRPTITSSVSATLTWGDDLNVSTPDSMDTSVDKAMLVRLGATTHITDADMRAVEVPVAKRSSGNLGFTLPTNRGALTPGYYRVFIVRETPDGPAPSTSSFIIRVAPAGFTTAAAVVKSLSASTTTTIGGGVQVPHTTGAKHEAAISGAVVEAAASKPAPRSTSQTAAVGVAALLAAAGAVMRRKVRRVKA